MIKVSMIFHGVTKDGLLQGAEITVTQAPTKHSEYHIVYKGFANPRSAYVCGVVRF